jgi:C1A family cysteine protease
MRALGWTRPQPHQLARCLRAGPEAGDSVLADVEPAATSNLYALCKVLDQGQLGACTAFAVVQAIRAACVRSGQVDPPFASMLALYYWARAQDGSQDRDVGTNIATVIDMAAWLGIPAEEIWPYVIERFAQRPCPAAYRDGYDMRGDIGVHYHPISSSGDAFIEDMERALTAGYPVVFGVDVSEEFCSQQPSGLIGPPEPDDKIAGGHALVAIGHDREQQMALILNSWGEDWHDPELLPGCCWFSYDYMLESSDRWIVPVAPSPRLP